MTKKTKKEIVKTITKAFADEAGNDKGKGQLTQELTKKIVQMTFNSIVEVLVEEGRIELRKFGVFQVKRRAPRKARNPRTGEKVDVSEKFVVTFKPGKEMVERVNEISDEIYEDWENGRRKDGGKSKASGSDPQSVTHEPTVTPNADAKIDLPSETGNSRPEAGNNHSEPRKL